MLYASCSASKTALLQPDACMQHVPMLDTCVCTASHKHVWSCIWMSIACSVHMQLNANCTAAPLQAQLQCGNPCLNFPPSLHISGAFLNSSRALEEP